MIEILLTMGVAGLAGFLLMKAKIPGGMLVGGVLGVACLSIFTDQGYMPTGGKVIAQSLAGAYIGTTVERHHLKQLKHMIKPAFIVIGTHFVVNLIVGTIIYNISPLDFKTAFLGAVPGGLNDIPLIAADMGADSPKVLALQMVRNLAGIGIFPTMIMKVTKPDNTLEEILENGSSTEKSTRNMMFTLAIGLAFGLVGSFTSVPAGTLLISMVGVLAFQILTQRAYLPMWCKVLAQLLSGAYIGSSMTASDVGELGQLLLPVALVLMGYTLSCFLIGILLHEFAGMSLRKGMLLGIPAGASDMALISSDLGINSPDIVVIQVIRLVVVVGVFPQVIEALSKIIT